MDSKLVGQNTAELMEALEEAYADDETAEVVEVISVAVIRTQRKPDTEEWADHEDQGHGYSFIHYRASEPAWHRQLGLLEAASFAVRSIG